MGSVRGFAQIPPWRLAFCSFLFCWYGLLVGDGPGFKSNDKMFLSLTLSFRAGTLGRSKCFTTLRTLVVAEFDGGVVMCADTRTSTGSIQGQIDWGDLLGWKAVNHVCDQTLGRRASLESRELGVEYLVASPLSKLIWKGNRSSVDPGQYVANRASRKISKASFLSCSSCHSLAVSLDCCSQRCA